MPNPLSPTAEPVRLGATVVVVVQALLAALLGFELVDWTLAQVGLVQALVVALVALGSQVVRARVSPVADG
ncbi:MAG: hypothetical protein WKF86_00220 [Acidimicrobiales bacterium]